MQVAGRVLSEEPEQSGKLPNGLRSISSKTEQQPFIISTYSLTQNNNLTNGRHDQQKNYDQ